MKRKKISKKLFARLIMEHRGRCLVCEKPISEGGCQVHHIDGDRNNNSWENLAILCLSCHNAATLGANKEVKGFTRKITPELLRELRIRKYKEFKKHQERNYKLLPRMEKNLWKFEVRRTKNLIAVSKKEEEIKKHFDYLFEIYFWEGKVSANFLLRELEDLAIRSGIEWKIVKSLTKILEDFFLYIVPEFGIKLKKRNEKTNFLKCINILDHLIFYHLFLTGRENIFNRLINSLKKFYLLAKESNFEEGKKRIRKCVNKYIRESESEIVQLKGSEKEGLKQMIRKLKNFKKFISKL